MKRGDVYPIVDRYGYDEPAEISAVRARPGWREFHEACGDIDVYFTAYRRTFKKVTVDVFTIENVFGPAYFLTSGSGHDTVSASIDGLRQSGGSSLKAWSAALTMQIEQLAEMID